MANAMEALRSAGVPVDSIPDEQRKVLDSLSDEEVSVLTRIQERLSSAGGDVEGYAMASKGDKGSLFW